MVDLVVINLGSMSKPLQAGNTIFFPVNSNMTRTDCSLCATKIGRRWRWPGTGEWILGLSQVQRSRYYIKIY